MNLSEAQTARHEELLDIELDRRIDLMLSAKTTGPEARAKLKNLLKYYAKKKHPFTACVRDNRKRFGPGTEAVCATLKDIIRGTTHWRGKNNKNDKGAKGIANLSEVPALDEETLNLLEQLTEQEIMEIING